MDPVSQGVLGAAAAQSVLSNPQKIFAATLLGTLGGMAPDLDVLIQSESDPLLFLEYHRQFTHSLVFIPIGGLLVTLALYFWSKRYLSFNQSYVFVTAGYSTHALLDACTTYGTLLFWPFSDFRFSWNNVSIIDPLFTIPLLVLCTLGVIKRKPVFGKLALAWSLIYLFIGVIQRERAEEFAATELNSRGVEYSDLSAKPSFANLLVWKVIAKIEGGFRVDAVKVGTTSKFYEGESIVELDVQRDFPNLPVDSVQRKDIERFRWFSSDHLAVSKTDPDLIVDVRYSIVPNEITGLWGIRIDQTNSNLHVKYEMFRDTSIEARKKFWRLLVD